MTPFQIRDLKAGTSVTQKGTVKGHDAGCVEIQWDGKLGDSVLYRRDALDGIEICDEPVTDCNDLKREILLEIAEAIQEAEPYDVTEKLYYNLLKRAGKI